MNADTAELLFESFPVYEGIKTQLLQLLGYSLLPFESFPVYEGIKTVLLMHPLQLLRLKVSLFTKGLRPSGYVGVRYKTSTFESFPVYEGIKTASSLST